MQQSEKYIEIFEKAENTLIKKGCKLSREDAIKKHNDKLLFFKNATDNDFYCKMAMVVLYSGFRAPIVDAKEPSIRKYFSNYKKVMHYDKSEIEKIMTDREMIRNLKKIESLIENAKAFFQVIEKYGSFREYLLSFNSNFPLSSNNINELKSDLQLRFKYFGPATVNHFLTDFGFPVLKPDRMVMRVMYRAHLLESESKSEYERAIEIGNIISKKLVIPIRYVDSVFAGLDQVGVANICKKNNPKCSKCELENVCNFYK